MKLVITPTRDYEERMVMEKIMLVVGKILIYFIAYFATVAATLSLSNWLWPEGLVAHTQNIFWPASGVNLAFVLRFGPRYAPVVLLGTIPAIFLMGEPIAFTLFGASGNMLEGLFGWWVLTRFGRFSGRFDGTRIVAALAVASILAALCATLTKSIAELIEHGAVVSDLGPVYLQYAFSNGCGIMLLTPFLYALWQCEWNFLRYPWEALVWLLVAVVVSLLAFDAVFQAKMNFAFMVFPLVIYAAVRWGATDCAGALFVIMLCVYASMIRYGSALPVESAPDVIWFVSAFVWVLSVTGLVVAALVTERRRAEQVSFVEKSRAIEADLREERARLDALRYQINPHFLFNSLNSVYAALPGASSAPKEMLAELSDYLRSVLDHPGSDFMPLREEFASIKKYVAIEQKRYGDDLAVTLELAPKTGEIPVPIFLLQPLVENAIRHAFAQSSQPLKIDVRSHLENEFLLLDVINSGEWKENCERRGIGLDNVRRRLKLLYKDRAMLERKVDGQRVCLRIKIPLEPLSPIDVSPNESPSS